LLDIGTCLATLSELAGELRCEFSEILTKDAFAAKQGACRILNDIYVRLRGRLQLSYMYAQALREPAAIIATT
jgi:hypothetical protein